MIGEDAVATRGRARRTTVVDERTWAAFDAFKAGITGRKGENAVARELARLGVTALRDALLADLFGVTQVDHLVRAPGAILVIETKTYGGHITGTPRGARWTQHLAGGETRHAFQSPAYQNHRHCQAVRAVVSGLEVPVVSYVVFAGSATFCAELEHEVVSPDRLAALCRATSPDAHDPAMLERAWQRLVAAVAAAEPRREEHWEAVRRRREQPVAAAGGGPAVMAEADLCLEDSDGPAG